jgi:hypothetical protein
MSDHEKRFKEASDEQVYLYASDPHRIIAARTQAERVRRDRESLKGTVKDVTQTTRSSRRAAIIGIAATCVLAILVAVAYVRAQS